MSEAGSAPRDELSLGETPFFLRPQAYAPKRGIAPHFRGASPHIPIDMAHEPGHSALPLLRTTLGDTVAKPPSRTRSARANASPLTLPSLLSVPAQPQPSYINPLDDPVIYRQLQHGRYHDPAADRRKYHPTPLYRPAHSLVRQAARLALGKSPTTVRFRIPNLVAICVRRKARREVLHALKRLNKGRGGGGKRRRNLYSNVQC